MINFAKRYNLIKITDIYIYQEKKGPRTEPCETKCFTEALSDT